MANFAHMILTNSKPKKATKPLEPITVTESELTGKLAELEAGGFWVHRMDVNGGTYTLHILRDAAQEELI